MAQNSEINFLMSLHVFKGLEYQDAEKIFFMMKPVSFKTGEVIINEGEEGKTMYFFKEGTVQISQQITLKLNTGKWGESEKSITTLDAQKIGFFGEMAVVTGLPRSATIKAVSDCNLYELSKENFETFAKREPRIAFIIMRNIAGTLSERVYSMNNNILKLTTALSIALTKKK